MKDILFAAVMLCAFSGLTQPTFVGLDDVFNYFHENQGVNFSYDAEVIELMEVRQDYPRESLEQTLQFLSEKFPLKFDPVGDDYFTVTLVSASYILNLGDSAGEPIVPNGPVAIGSGSVTLYNNIVEDNQVTLEYKPRKNDTLVLQVFGYNTRYIPFAELLTGKNLNISLTPQTYYLQDIVIRDFVTRGINLDPQSHHIAIQVQDLALLPGETDGDILASLAVLPGITTPDSRPGNLNIRGSTTDQSFFLFDGIPIYHRGHFFGTISPYNPEMIEEVQVYRNGFHPRLGGRVGGGVEIRSPDEVESEFNGGIGSNSLYTSVYTKIPLIKSKWGFSVGGRRSFPWIVHSPKFDPLTEQVYAASSLLFNGELADNYQVIIEDYSGKTTFQPNPNQKFSISALYARTITDYETGPEELHENSGFFNRGINLNWTSRINDRLTSSLSVIDSKYRFEFMGELPNPTPDGRERESSNEIQDIIAKQEFDVDLDGGNKLQAGLEYKLQELSYLNQSPNRRMDSMLMVRERADHLNSISPFANLEWHVMPSLSFQIGSRATYYFEDSRFLFTPRIFGSYDLNKDLIIKGSWGLFNQFISQVKGLDFGETGFENDLWVLANDDDVPVMTGSQSMFGGIFSWRSLVVDVEGFYKTVNDAVYSTTPRVQVNTQFIKADHVIYGVDLFVKKRFDHLAIWAGYSYNHAELSFDSLREVTYKLPYNQPHVIYTGGSLSSGRWSLSYGWRLASGLIGKPTEMYVFEQGYERRLAMQQRNGVPPGQQPLSEENPYAQLPHRYPYIHSLDLSASYYLPETDKRPWSATFGLSLVNVYDQKNLIDKAVRTDVLVARYAMRFAPNLMIMFEW